MGNETIVKLNMYIFEIRNILDLRAYMTKNIIYLKRPSRSVNSQQRIYRKKFSGGPTEQPAKIIKIKINLENKTDSRCYRKYWCESVKFHESGAAVCSSPNPVKGLIVVRVCKTGRTKNHRDGNRTRRSLNRTQRVNKTDILFERICCHITCTAVRVFLGYLPRGIQQQQQK